MTPPDEFRAFCSQLLVLLAMESTRTLLLDKAAETAALSAGSTRPVLKRMVLLSLSSPCLGLVHQAADFIPDVSVGLVNFPRPANSQHHEPRLHLVNAPALAEARVIIFNPVVTTGALTGLALDLLSGSGAKDVTLLCFLTSADGLGRILRTHPSLNIWTSAVISEPDPRRNPFLGLSDFGKRLYG
jgi:uracil phosphoribosyltransferase